MPLPDSLCGEEGRGERRALPPFEAQLGIGTELLQEGRDLAGELGGSPLALGGPLEKEQGGQGLPGYVLGLEDARHLQRQRLDLFGAALAGVQLRQLEGDQGGVEGHLALDELLPQLAEELDRLVRVAQ